LAILGQKQGKIRCFQGGKCIIQDAVLGVSTENYTNFYFCEIGWHVTTNFQITNFWQKFDRLLFEIMDAAQIDTNRNLVRLCCGRLVCNNKFPKHKSFKENGLPIICNNGFGRFGTRQKSGAVSAATPPQSTENRVIQKRHRKPRGSHLRRSNRHKPAGTEKRGRFSVGVRDVGRKA
jgi:DNA-directed RNA polymerase subunit N (RpoN/RPB10)